MHIQPPQRLTAANNDTAGRTVTGLALPYGVPGHSSKGTVIAEAGSVELPADLKRIKLYRDHSNVAGSPVGYCTSATETAEGIEMSFRIGSTPDGDAALADVTEGIRDALSVEIVGAEIGAGGRLTAGTITAVALVAVPAFADARVASFTASLHPAPAEADAGEDAPPVPPPAPPAPDLEPPADADADADAEDDAGDVDTSADNDNNTQDDQEIEMPEKINPPAEQESKLAAAAAPAGLTAARVNTAAPAVTFSSVVDTLLGVREGRERDAMMTAALADITQSAHPHVASPAWLGELWSGVSYTREIIPTMTSRQLTGRKATGWRWTTRPTVDDYLGDKTEIPTNTPVTEAVELTAKRIAGGHDIDRAYFDFNDREFIESYFRAMTESYAMVTDDRAAEFLVTEAAENIGDTQADLLRAAAKARQLVKRGTRTEATTYLVNPDDMFELLDVTTMDNPAYLELIGVDPSKFITSDLAPAGSVIAYAKPAVEWYELGSSPIRVEAEHLARGGRDAALFGYWAAFVTNPAGLVTVPFGAGA